MIAGKKSQGFTLFELIVVLAIIGILAAMAMPKFSKLLAEKRAQQGAMDIIYAFNQARSQAALTGKSTTLKKLDSTNQNYAVMLGTTTLANFSLNNALTVTTNAPDSPSSITVNPNGKTPNGPWYFRVCDSRVSGIDGYSVWIYPSGLSRFVKGKGNVDTTYTNSAC